MRPLFILLCCIAACRLTAQGETTAEAVNAQKQFIDAKQEALLGKTDAAIALFREITEGDSRNDPAYFELARLQYAAGRSPEAITAMEKAYALRENEVYAAFLAELYRSAGKYAEGAELYAGLIKKYPTEADLYLERAAFQVRDQDIKGALATYNALEDRIGVNAELARRKHALYLGSGDRKRAERELLNLVEAFPRQLEYRHLLAGYYESQEEDKQARRVYEEILTIEPADVRAQLALQDAPSATDGSATGDDAELMALLARTDVDLDLKVGKLLPLIQQVASSGDRGLADRALRLAAELRRVHPDAAKATAIAGDLYFHSGRLPEAAEAYRATLELDDTVYPVWEQLLGTLYLDNQIAELRDLAESALDIFPNRPAIYVHYAIGEALRSDFSAADDLLGQARMMVSGSPESAAALDELATALNRLEQGGDDPVNTALLPGGDKGVLAVLLGSDRTRAPALLHPRNTNALLLERLGDMKREGGDTAAAAGLYLRAQRAGSKSPTLPAKLARVKS
jgi:tetratricopeptide (TPR) repeat protein